MHTRCLESTSGSNFEVTTGSSYCFLVTELEGKLYAPTNQMGSSLSEKSIEVDKLIIKKQKKELCLMWTHWEEGRRDPMTPLQ